MSATTTQRNFLAPDIMYFLTFVLGMGGFWLSGYISGLLPVMKDANLAALLGMAVTSFVYGAILAVWTMITSRGPALKRVVVAVIPAVVLGIGAAQVIVRLASGKITNLTSLGILTFILFVCYGLIYVLSLALARRVVR